MSTIAYHAGSDVSLPFTIDLKIPTDINHSYLIARWVEFWCDSHCEDDWRIELYPDHLSVGFVNETDAVMFKLSPEYTLD